MMGSFHTTCFMCHTFHVPYKGSLTPDVFHCVHTSMGNVNNKPNNSNGPPARAFGATGKRVFSTTT